MTSLRFHLAQSISRGESDDRVSWGIRVRQNGDPSWVLLSSRKVRCLPLGMRLGGVVRRSEGNGIHFMECVRGSLLSIFQYTYSKVSC